MLKYFCWALALILAHVNTTAWAGAIRNSPPIVSLATPTNGATFTSPANITLSANASDAGGILRVEFFQGSALIATDMTAPYSVLWNNVTGGTYNLTAVATDNLGAVTTSAVVTITVSGAKIFIASPANGAFVYGNSYSNNIQVSGTFTGDSTATIFDSAATVLVSNGNSTLLATLSTNTFSATVPIFLGSNTLTVSVNRRDKTSDTASIVITGNDYPKAAFRLPSAATFDAPANILFDVDAVSPAGTISKVQFYKAGLLLGTVTAPPYQYTLPNAGATSYTIQATATDNAGYTNSVTTTVTGQGPNTSPVISLTAPLDGAIFTTPANIILTANATDSDGSITAVEFLQNNILLASTNVAPYSFSWSNVPLGSYTLTARATDNRNSTVTSAPANITVMPPNTPPTVSLSPPVAGAIYYEPDTIPLNASATDSDGSITQVEFFSSGTRIGIATSAPYTVNWSNMGQGSHAITAKATDNQGGTATSAPVTIVVYPLSIQIASPASGVALSANNVLVSGTFTAPAYAGVTVNGVIAVVAENGNFYANAVPLAQGSNTLTATVTTLDERTLSHSIILTGGIPDPAQVSASPVEGIGSVSTQVNISNLNLIQGVDIDTNGDGIIDFTTNGNPTFTPGQDTFALTLNYATPWTYQLVVTVTDSLGNVTTHKFVIKVHDPVPMARMFNDLWNRMLDNLRADNIPAALTSISGGMRDKYQSIFTALQPNLATVASQLGDMLDGTLGMEMAEYLLARTSNNVTRTYPLYFIRGEDGVWRIDGM